MDNNKYVPLKLQIGNPILPTLNIGKIPTNKLKPKTSKHEINIKSAFKIKKLVIQEKKLEIKIINNTER